MKITIRRTVERTFNNPSNPDANWILYANTYATDVEAYSALIRCKSQYPDSTCRLTVETFVENN